MHKGADIEPNLRPQRCVVGFEHQPLHKTFDLPADATAFSIGYTGRTRIGGPEGKGRVFRHSPF